MYPAESTTNPVPEPLPVTIRTTLGRASSTMSATERLAVGTGVGVSVWVGVDVGMGVGVDVWVGTGVPVGVGVGVWVAVGVGVWVEVGVGVRVAVGVQVGAWVGVGVGRMATTVACTPAATVASMSGCGVGVAVGSAMATTACTVAAMSGVGSAGAGPPQPASHSAAQTAVIASSPHARVPVGPQRARIVEPTRFHLTIGLSTLPQVPFACGCSPMLILPTHMNAPTSQRTHTLDPVCL